MPGYKESDQAAHVFASYYRRFKIETLITVLLSRQGIINKHKQGGQLVAILNKELNMKTYKTFAECKLANPECNVYRTAYGNDFAPEAITPDYAKRNPADFLMSMGEFFDKGYSFVVGDAYLEASDCVEVIESEHDLLCASERHKGDYKRYILKAKALESCTSHGIASIQSASGHIEPIECEPVEQVLRRLSSEIDRALQSASLSNGMRECLKSVISQVDDELLIQEAYSLHCEFYGNDAADFCAFKDDVGVRSLWLHFAKKLQEQA
jgi:hypothetical protein